MIATGSSKSNQEKVLRRLFGDRVKGRSKDPVIPAENLADSIRRDPGIRQIIEAFLASDDCDTAIFNVAGIHELLAAHYESGADYSVPIAWMATYSLSLPCFVYGQRSEVPTEARGLRPTG